MIQMRNLKPSGVAVAAAAVLAAFSVLAAWRLSGALPSAGAAPSPESAEFFDPAVTEKATPLDCRVVLLTPLQRRAEMEKDEWLRNMLREHSVPATPHLFANPLVASSSWARVEVENTSGQDFPIRAWDGRLFQVGYRVQNAAGNPVTGWSGDITKYSNKRITVSYRPIPDWLAELYPLKNMTPGQVETDCLTLVGGPPTECHIAPGKYTIRAVCTYFWSPDLAERKIQSRPFRITVTEEDVQEWKELYK